ncbi:pimeloyl-ACP methyl ester carboxylesterase [Paraburkholderia sp. EB58]|jgi:pimeloyl-ACP methyl ester carboxylesterase|uniref:alpha/beta fold hydrolase n=1 Tax=Paraburkholderia sp. EB58 TaxID=3035125 RepID=UPI003D242E25
MTQSTDARKSKGKYFTHRGQNIFWREEGRADAPTLLLIHGFPTASWDWEPVWADLLKRYRLLTLDMIGFGYSDKPRDYTYSIMDQADIYDELLALRGVSSFHILAHDYGDTVAQELIARDFARSDRPELRSVCFLNGGLFPETHRRVRLQSLLLSPIGPLVSLLTNRKKLSQNMSAVFGKEYPLDSETLDSMWDMLRLQHGERIMHKLIHYIPERVEHRDRWVGGLQKTGVPLKLIVGSVDPISGSHMANRYREVVPRPDVSELAGVGHYPQVQAPGAVMSSYLEFRDRVARVCL